MKVWSTILAIISCTGAMVGVATGQTLVLVAAVTLALVVLCLPVWPRRIEIRLGLSPYRHEEAKKHLRLKDETSVHLGSLLIWVTPDSALRGCTRFTLSLLDTDREDLKVTVSGNAAMVKPNPIRNARYWLGLLRREDVVWWARSVNGLDYVMRYATEDPVWLPIRTSRLLRQQVSSLKVSDRRTIVVRFVNGDSEYEFRPEQMRIIIEPTLQGVYVIPRMDFDENYAPCREMLIVAPSLEAIRHISVGLVADMVAVAYRHPGVLCRICGYPHGLESQVAKCYCGRFDSNPHD